MADMSSLLKAINLMAGDDAGVTQNSAVAPTQSTTPGAKPSLNFGGEELTCLIGVTAPGSAPSNWTTEVIDGVQVSYDPLMFKRGNVDNGRSALRYCGPMFGIVQQPIGLTDYSYMFARSNITKANLDRWDVSKVKDMEGMFSTCMGLKELRVGSWNVKMCRHMKHMMENCLSLEVLEMSKWEPDNLEEVDGMFKAVDESLIPEWYNDWI